MRVPWPTRTSKGTGGLWLLGWVAVSLVVVGVVRGAAGTWSGSLPATVGPRAPLSIPLQVAKSELVTVVATGQIKLGDGPWTGPEGTTQWHHDVYGYTHGIVVSRISAADFPTEGGARTYESPCSGPIAIYINDDVTNDNQGSFSVTVTIGPPVMGDADEDGIEDQLEDTLLDMYAPQILFDTDEDSANARPAEAYWLLRNSELRDGLNDDDRLVLGSNRAPFFVEWFLAQEVQGGQSTNYILLPGLREAAINIYDDYSRGMPWSVVDAAHNVGIYGHVVPFDDMYLLQYWMLYGFNQTGYDWWFLHPGDHEGDWELFEIYLDAAAPTDVSRMKKAVWYGHGKTYLGRWVAGGEVELIQDAYALGDIPEMPQQHPPIYVEAGTHGSWPCNVYYSEYPNYIPKNRGNSSHNFTARNVTNLGEIYRPRLGTEVVTQLSCIWGAWHGLGQTCPEGPSLHRNPGHGNWVDAPSGNNPARYVGWWDHGRVHPNGESPMGMIDGPHGTVLDAVLHATPGQTILIYPGHYEEGMTVGRAMTLRAPHGNVLIEAR